MQWDIFFLTFGITINNSESVKSGTSWHLDQSHLFDQSKKITKIVTTVNKHEWDIMQIKFFSGEEVLCTVGYDDDDVKKYGAGRVETFEIAADEQFFGCELDHGTDGDGDDDFFLGVTWLKWKIN